MVAKYIYEEQRMGQAVDASNDWSSMVSSTKKFLVEVRALLVCIAEVDRLTN